ncbi:MAG TPA: VanZ family protein [Flavobacterium sp.]|uniref:VanZ family protein n=1 Tax=Flavobacterium sp. TaxID=239 RepID=UPI002BDAD042|nr:VanZ family protein [Flavobacterium sp.]HSD13452.1 VanZ family protein [Flavobacterium sp.]
MEHKKNFLLAILWTLAIAAACLISMDKVPTVPVFGKDKTIHSFFYLVFSILWFLFLSKEFPKWTFIQKALVVLVSSFLYGGIIEICQGLFTTSRQADLLDVLANMSGSVIAVIALFLITRLKKLSA